MEVFCTYFIDYGWNNFSLEWDEDFVLFTDCYNQKKEKLTFSEGVIIFWIKSCEIKVKK